MENEDIHQENCCYSFTTTGVKRSGVNMTALNQSEMGGFNGGIQLIWPMATHWIP